MNSVEWLQAKLSLDTSALGRAKRDIDEFSESGRSGFVNVGSEARSFHELMRKITEQSPIMGTALKLALSPVIGTMGAAMAIFATAGSKLEAYNQMLDKTGERNAEALTDIRKINAAVREVQEGVERGRQSFEAEQKNRGNPILEALQTEETERRRMADEDAKRRQDAHTEAVRKVEDEFKVRKQRLDDYYDREEAKLRMSGIHGPRREALGFQLGERRRFDERGLEREQVEATRDLQDKHEAEERAAKLVEQQRRRAELEKKRAALLEAGMKAEKELDEARKKRADPAFTRSLEKAKEQAEFYAKNLQQIKPERDKANAQEADESANWRNRPYWWLNVLGGTRIGGKAQNLLNLPEDANRQALNENFWKFTREQKGADHKLAQFQAEDKARSDAVTQRQNAFANILAAHRQVNSELRGMPAASDVGPPGMIDPLTGGYALRGLKDMGGIAYKPLPGSLGYQAPSAAPRHSAESDEHAKMLRWTSSIFEAIGGDKQNGVPVNIINVKDDTK